MKRWEAVQTILKIADNALFVHANGMISREAFEVRDMDESFYMIGSMGQACSIGLGVAMCQPNRRVVVMDGDGNLLSNLGVLAMVGKVQPRNLVHVVLDNEVYDSTGGQRSVSDDIGLDALAAASGYRNVWRLTDTAQLRTAYEHAAGIDGPSFLHVKVEAGNMASIGRVTVPPDRLARRFQAAASSWDGGAVQIVEEPLSDSSRLTRKKASKVQQD